MWVAKHVLKALEAKIETLESVVVFHRKELGEERTKVLMLERALATSQSNVEWMRVFANTLSHDRDALAKSKGVELSGPQFEGRLQTIADVEAAAVARARAREAAGGAPAEVGRALDATDDLESAMAAYTGHVNGFEDVGDEAAARQGIQHNEEDGTVEHLK